MQVILTLIAAVVIVMLAWGLVKFLIGAVLGPIITIGMLLLFCFLVFVVYQALSGKQKNIL